MNNVDKFENDVIHLVIYYYYHSLFCFDTFFTLLAYTHTHTHHFYNVLLCGRD